MLLSIDARVRSSGGAPTVFSSRAKRTPRTRIRRRDQRASRSTAASVRSGSEGVHVAAQFLAVTSKKIRVVGRSDKDHRLSFSAWADNGGSSRLFRVPGQYSAGSLSLESPTLREFDLDGSSRSDGL